MLRTIGFCEKNIFPVPAKAITVASATSTVVVPEMRGNADEIAYVTIQNTTSNLAYYAFGQTCNSVSNFHGVLGLNSAVPVPYAGSVEVYSPNGTVIAVCIFKRVCGL